MKHTEKKFLVEDFDAIKEKLAKAGAKHTKYAITTHYYGRQSGNDVTKLFQSADRCEIHILKESDGTFTLTEKIKVKSKEDGLNWLKKNGFDTIEVVKMAYVDFEYQDGIVGLYVINDFLHSVILDFPPKEHTKMEKLLGLDKSEIIKAPYNKYLESIGKAELLK